MGKRIPFSLSIILVMKLLIAPLCTAAFANPEQTLSYDSKQRTRAIDFDGDGKTDIATWTPENGLWTILRSSDRTTTYTTYGAPNDILVPGDYDGDGKTDIAVWRPSNGFWYIKNSSDGSYTFIQLGAPNDVPVTQIRFVSCNTWVNYKLWGYDIGFYQGTQDPNLGSTVSETQIRDHLQVIAPYTNWIRTFGSTAGLESVARIAREFRLKTAIGVWLSSNTAANQQEMTNLIAAAQAGYVDMAVVGNEVLLRGDLKEEQLIGYINQFRQAVTGIPVTTGEVYSVLLSHPNVIAACDAVFANFYPYWEGIRLDYAVANVDASYNELVNASGSKEVVVSETGWPSGGNQVGDAIPSLDNACFYFLNFVSWARAKNVKYFYFEAFDEPWKAAYEGPQGATWGTFDSNKNLKACMQNVFDGHTMADNWSCQLPPGGAGTPQLLFTYVPPIGSFDNLKGQVNHILPKDYRVVVYIKVNGGWWIKPYLNQPLTAINCDGTWVCDITTGGIDEQATEVAAYLVSAGYNPPLTLGGPLDTVDLNASSVANVHVTR